MKQLKVRVWDIDTGKISAGVDICLLMRGIKDLEFPKTNETLSFNDFLFYRREYSNWMLFTGLPDSNGNEIYEGDILNAGDFTSEVIFEDGCFCIQNKKARYKITIADCIRKKIRLEIIGNIFEYNKQTLR